MLHRDRWYEDVDWWIVGIISFFVISISAVVAGAVASVRVETRCIRMGYSGGGMTLGLVKVCQRTVNQTEYTVLLEDAVPQDIADNPANVVP